MEKEEKKVIDQTVEHTVDNNATPVVESTDNVVDSKEDEKENPEDNPTVDNNTEVDPEPTTDEPVTEPVVDPVTEPTVNADAPLTGDPVLDAPVEDPTLATTDEVIPAVPGEAAIAEPVVTDPVVTEPVEPVVDPIVDIDNPPVDTVIPEDPATLAPAEPVDAPVENPEPVDAGCPCGDPNCDGACGVEPTTPCESPVTVANFFGTLQECVTIVWRFHLKTRKHHIHVDLGDFYQGALYKVDKIIEEYQGIVGIIEDPFTNCVVGDGKTEGEYLTELKAFIENNRCVVGGHSEIDSSIDDFLGLIDSTLYKITSFTESAVKSFEEFCYEDYQVDESCKYFSDSDDESDEEE